MTAAHPLYTALDRLMERGMSRRRMKRMLCLLDRFYLPVPVDFALMLINVGITL